MTDKNTSSNRNNNQKNRRIFSMKKGKKRTLRTALMIVLGVIIFSVVALGVYTIVAIAQTPDFDTDMILEQKQSSIVYDKEGKPIAQLHASENRLLVEFEDIPPIVRDTFVAVEDKRFYSHHGADPIRIVKSALNNLKAGEVVEGGSTITIQLAKIAFIEDPTVKKLKRKIQELVLAIQIERTYTKDEILTFYLNRIFFGESSFGIRTASQTYFGKELEELNPAEVALLAGLPQAPSAYDPYVNPDKAKNRRNIVLSVMRDNNIITEAEYKKSKEEPFTFVDQVKARKAEVNLPNEAATRNKNYPYFVDKVIAELQEKYNLEPEQIYNGGLHIYATVDSKIQEAAEKSFANADNFPRSSDEIPVQGAMTVLESETGAIAAMVGGREYTPMGLNRAWQSTRQPGSTAKPLVVYAPALEHGGYYPGTVFDDMPVKFSNGTGGAWAPVDYDTETSGWKGLITMREAVRDSVNVYAVKLMQSLGVNYSWQFAKNNLGLNMTENDRFLTLALGTFQISTLQMASAYGTFANNGVKTEPYSVLKVVGPDGNTIVENTPSQKRVMKETTAYVMNDLLRTVVTSGTGTRARIGNWYICGKTGTTSLDPEKYGYKTGNPDAWFAGYSPKYVGVVWMGYDNTDEKHYLYKVYGGNYPARIWKDVMTVAHQDLPVQSSIDRPQGISTVRFDTKSGFLPSSLTPEGFISTEICASDSIPTSVGNIWVEVSNGLMTKLCLNVPNRPKDVTWPKDEEPYKMPGEDEGSAAAESSPPAGDAGIPGLTVSTPGYDIGSGKVRIPVVTDFDSGQYSLILFISKPGMSSLVQYAPEDNSINSISYRLNTLSGSPTPGTYTFWAALIDNNSYVVGPPSNPVTLELTD